MGVTNLWQILSPVQQHKPLSSLKDQTLAVDLSIWVCETQGVKQMQGVVSKPFLRNLFFRISHLVQLGVNLVFVVEGEAPVLKWEVMMKRQQMRFPGKPAGRGRGYRGGCKQTRRNFNSCLKECCELLDYLGIPYLQSNGEAEAMCAVLNAAGVVDGCITNDGDAFLYGARTVYRNFTLKSKDPHVESYNMSDIEDQLGLDRDKLVAMALLLGCDYVPKGVPGIGMDKAIKLMTSLQGFCVLNRFKKWQNMSDKDCIDQLEVLVKRKAMSVSDFPQQKVIEEFMQIKDKCPAVIKKWRRPVISKLQDFALVKLEWPTEYTLEKVLSLVTLWDMNDILQSPNSRIKHLLPKRIVKSRIRQGVACFEVEWIKPENFVIDESKDFITIEEQDMFSKCYPDIVSKYQEELENKKSKPKGERKKQGKTCKESNPENEVRLSQIDAELSSQLCGINLETQQQQRCNKENDVCTPKVFTKDTNIDSELMPLLQEKIQGHKDLSHCAKDLGKTDVLLTKMTDRSKGISGNVEVESITLSSSDDEMEEYVPLSQRIRQRVSSYSKNLTNNVLPLRDEQNERAKPGKKKMAGDVFSVSDINKWEVVGLGTDKSATKQEMIETGSNEDLISLFNRSCHINQDKELVEGIDNCKSNFRVKPIHNRFFSNASGLLSSNEIKISGDHVEKLDSQIQENCIVGKVSDSFIEICDEADSGRTPKNVLNSISVVKPLDEYDTLFAQNNIQDLSDNESVCKSTSKEHTRLFNVTNFDNVGKLNFSVGTPNMSKFHLSEVLPSVFPDVNESTPSSARKAHHCFTSPCIQTKDVSPVVLPLSHDCHMSNMIAQTPANENASFQSSASPSLFSFNGSLNQMVNTPQETLWSVNGMSFAKSMVDFGKFQIESSLLKSMNASSGETPDKASCSTLDQVPLISFTDLPTVDEDNEILIHNFQSGNNQNDNLNCSYGFDVNVGIDCSTSDEVSLENKCSVLDNSEIKNKCLTSIVNKCSVLDTSESSDNCLTDVVNVDIDGPVTNVSCVDQFPICNLRCVNIKASTRATNCGDSECQVSEVNPATDCIDSDCQVSEMNPAINSIDSEHRVLEVNPATDCIYSDCQVSEMNPGINSIDSEHQVLEVNPATDCIDSECRVSEMNPGINSIDSEHQVLEVNPATICIDIETHTNVKCRSQNPVKVIGDIDSVQAIQLPQDQHLSTSKALLHHRRSKNIKESFVKDIEFGCEKQDVPILQSSVQNQRNLDLENVSAVTKCENNCVPFEKVESLMSDKENNFKANSLSDKHISTSIEDTTYNFNYERKTVENVSILDKTANFVEMEKSPIALADRLRMRLRAKSVKSVLGEITGKSNH